MKAGVNVGVRVRLGNGCTLCFQSGQWHGPTAEGVRDGSEGPH